MKKNQKKTIAIFAFSLVCLIGTYNAVMINSESTLSNNTDLKRLADIKVGRQLAVSTDWRKVSKVELKNEVVAPVVAKTESVSTSQTESQASINDDLNLKLVEVINTKKWAKGVQAADFNGSITANNGIIEALSASLPEGHSIDISFSEMTGNTFEYDLNGEVYTGMMYQVDQSSYMVTMTNGPLEGTRLRFAGEAQDPQAQEAYLAENHNVEVGAFGEEIEAPQTEVQPEAQTQTAETASFNFNI